MNTIPDKSLDFIFYFMKKNKTAFIIFTIMIIVENMIITNITVFTLKYIIDYIAELHGKELWQKLLPALLIYCTEWLIWLIIIYTKPILYLMTLGKLEINIRNELFDFTSQHSMHFYINNFGGTIANKINNIIMGSRDAIAYFIVDVVVNILSVIFFMVVFAKTNYIFSIVMLIWLIISLSLSFPYISSLKKRSRELADTKSKFTGSLVDIFGNFSVVKGYANEKYEKSRIEKETSIIFEALKKFNFTKLKARGIPQTFTLLFIIATLVFSIYLKDKNLITMGSLVFLVNASIKSLWLVTRFTEGFMQVIDSIGTLSEGLNKIIQPHLINNSENAKDIKIPNGKIIIKDLKFEYKK